MKKIKIMLLGLMFLLIVILPSCAIIFCGSASECQRTKPAPGQPSREVHVGALVADILIFWPSLIVDFATSAIYKPCTNK
jgi:hypothetical protein